MQACAVTHPEIPAATVEAMAAAAYGYAGAPEYPSDDRDEIFGRMPGAA